MNAMTGTPRRVELVLEVDDPRTTIDSDVRDWDPDTWTVAQVQWQAYRGALGVVVEVTAFTRRPGARNHGNKSWYMTPDTVAADLNPQPPPGWVPAPPPWFDAFVQELLSSSCSATRSPRPR